MEHTIATSAFLEISNLGKGWVLAARAQEVAERFKLNSAGAALVEQGERFFVVCAGLRGRHGAISIMSMIWEGEDKRKNSFSPC